MLTWKGKCYVNCDFRDFEFEFAEDGVHSACVSEGPTCRDMRYCLQFSRIRRL